MCVATFLMNEIQPHHINTTIHASLWFKLLYNIYFLNTLYEEPSLSLIPNPNKFQKFGY